MATGGASRMLPVEGAIRQGYGVPVIAPGCVSKVLCNSVPIDHVIAFSCVQGWVCCYPWGAPKEPIPPNGRWVELRLDGRVEVA